MNRKCHIRKCFSREDDLQKNILSLRADLYSTEDCFICHDCKKSFRAKQYLEDHIKDHMNAKTNIIKKYICPMCYEAFANETAISDHFEVIHDVPIEKQHFQFSSKSEFDSWKKHIQISMNCSYIHNSLHYDEHCTGKQIWKWQCHQNENFTPLDPHKRQPSRGSKKLNTFCPSMIKLVLKPDNYNNFCCDVEFIPTHIGHSPKKNELLNVHFDSDINDKVAAKLEAEIPGNRIVKDIKYDGCYVSNELSRKEQLILNADVRNISNPQNISNTNFRNQSRCQNDVDPLEAYIFDPVNKNSILFFKNHGENHPVFRDKDFVLIIMTIEQMEKLKKYGSDTVCLGSTTHCTNLYDYTLHTLLIVDEYEEGFPCCFMISNKNNDIAYRYMFSAIKEKVGIFKPLSFMSNIQDIYINAWRTVMEYEPEFVLWCTWHVKKAWKEHFCLVKPVEKREALKTQLNDLHEELDKTKFHEKLLKFVLITDKDYKKFIDYFIDEYASKYQSWAYAYRQHAGINTNRHIQVFHKLLKYNLKDVKCGKLQDLLHALDDVMWHIKENYLIYSVKGKLTTKDRFLRAAHEEALKFKFVENLVYQKGEKEYIVKSLSDALREYTILRIDCNAINCAVKCTECQVCIHEFRCTCIENSIRSNMCKHIHLLCLQLSGELLSEIVYMNIENLVQDETINKKSGVHVENQVDVNIQNYHESGTLPIEVQIEN